MQDEEIIDLYFARNEQAISETSKKYGKTLTGLSQSITGNGEDAEECVNDAYFDAWKRIPPVRPVHFLAWLSKIVRSFSYKILEKKHAQKRGVTLELTEELAQCLKCEETVESAVDARALSALIDRFVRDLDDRSRDVFMKRYFWSCPIGTIEKETGYSASKIKSILFRARKKLKNELIKEGFI